MSRLGADTVATERNHSWVLAVLTLLLQLPVVTSWSGHRTTERNHSWVLAVLLQLPVVTSWSGHRSNGTESLLGPGSPHSPPSASRCHVLERTQEQRNGTTPGSWQSSLSSFSFPLSGLGRHRSNGTESLLGPGSPHSHPSASRCHVLERTQEQRNGITPGSWQSSLSSFSFPLSRLGADTGATERNDSWVLAVLLQLPVVTSWSGHRSNGTEPPLGPGSPPSASRCHVFELTQEQRNGTTPGSWQSSLSSFSFPLSRLGADTGATERNHSWVLAVLTLLKEECFSFPLSRLLERTQEQRNGTTPGSWQSSLSSFSFPLSRLGADTGATERNHSWVLAVLRSVAPVVLQDVTTA